MLFRFDDFDRTFSAVNDLHRRLEQFFGDERSGSFARGAERAWCELQETDDALFVRADLPGLREEDLEITLHEEVLTLTGERKVDVPEGHRIHLRERRPYRFTRSFALPSRVDPEKVRATLEHGVLTVELVKTAAAQPRQINVSRG
jgi:HSP20 family protein